MKEYKNLSLFLLCLLAVSALAYYGAKPNNPKNTEIYDTKNLTPEQKVAFDDSIKTGDAYVYYGDHEKAVKSFKQSEQLNPQDRQTLYRLASSQYNAKQYQEAEQTLKKLEKSEYNDAGYWSFRAENMSRMPDSLKNIKLAVKYVERAYNLSKYKDSWMFLETRAKIYFEEYKYYKLRRLNGTEDRTKDENKVKEKFLNALNDLNNLAISKNDSLIKAHHDDLYSQYLSFPNGSSKSDFEDLPELQPVEYSKADIERIKNNRPQDNLPAK